MTPTQSTSRAETPHLPHADSPELGVAASSIQPIAELLTAEGSFPIQERRRTPRTRPSPRPTDARSAAGSAQMMGLGGVIILLVLVGSYTTKYDAAIGHAGGALGVPAVGYLALQVFLARAALRLYDDVKKYRSIPEFIMSRVFRYLPAVMPAVLFGFVVISLVPMPGFVATYNALPSNLLMMADMIGAPEIDASHWRLKIEIIQAVLVAAAWYGPARRYLPVLLTIALGVTAISVDGEPVRRHVMSMQGLMTNDGYLPLFVFGVALYQLTQDRTSRVWQALLCAAAALSFMANTPLHGAVVVAGLVVLTLTALGGLRFMGRFRWLTHLGELAFPIYVVHYVLGFAIIHRLESVGCPAPVAIIAASLAAIMIGKILNAFCERPLQARGPALIKAAHGHLELRFPAMGVLRDLAQRGMMEA